VAVVAISDSQPDANDMNLALGQSLAHRMGITITEASPQRVVGTMPVAGNTQPYGLLHGGASCVLAETLGSVGAALHAGPDRFTLGIEINATHHRAAADGYVTGVASAVHAGRTLATYDIVISDEHGLRVCTARLSCLIRDAVPGRGPRAMELRGTGADG
jgi:1,4-dihydroxy-2-naphthoyl-CoA hydrolase